jgi:aromatic ring hydroxylase
MPIITGTAVSVLAPGFGDLLIGAGALMTEANGLDMATVPHLRDSMAELIKLVEGFFACGVAASVYGIEDPSGSWMPEPIFSNVGQIVIGNANLRHAPDCPRGVRGTDCCFAGA